MLEADKAAAARNVRAAQARNEYNYRLALQSVA